MLIKSCFLILCFAQLQPELLEPYREKARSWEKDVSALVAKNAEKTAGGDDLLLIGSSSVRLWDSIDEDMRDFSVVRRGYGGARYSDLVVYFERLLDQHHPKAILYFVANDISGDDDHDVTPEEVGRLTQHIASRTRLLRPNTPIYFIQITPTPKRWHLWPVITLANREIQKTTDSVENCYFIRTQHLYLDPNLGTPKPELYRDDRLHLSDAGYDLWALAIQASLKQLVRK